MPSSFPDVAALNPDDWERLSQHSLFPSRHSHNTGFSGGTAAVQLQGRLLHFEVDEYLIRRRAALQGLTCVGIGPRAFNSVPSGSGRCHVSGQKAYMRGHLGLTDRHCVARGRRTPLPGSAKLLCVELVRRVRWNPGRQKVAKARSLWKVAGLAWGF